MKTVHTYVTVNVPRLRVLTQREAHYVLDSLAHDWVHALEDFVAAGPHQMTVDHEAARILLRLNQVQPARVHDLQDALETAFDPADVFDMTWQTHDLDEANAADALVTVTTPIAKCPRMDCAHHDQDENPHAPQQSAKSFTCCCGATIRVTKTQCKTVVDAGRLSTILFRVGRPRGLETAGHA